MAHWKHATVTDVGVEMLNEWMAGRKITITRACGGTGTVDPAKLAGQTGLVDARQELHLLGEENNPEGKTVLVQVENTGLAEEYELNQVGVYAKLDADRDPDAAEGLLFVMQDEKGVAIPSATEASFLLELYCAIGITNNGRFDVSVSAAGIVTAAYLRMELERAIAAHNMDPAAHNSLTARMGAMEVSLNGSVTIIQPGGPTVETVGQKGQHYIDTDTGKEYVCGGVSEEGYVWEPVKEGTSIRDLLEEAGNVGTQLEDLDGRLGLLELMYRTQVNGNPYSVTFGDLSGLRVTGVWNEPMKRLEF